MFNENENDNLSMNKIFIELIQVALGTREGLSRVPNAREWEGLYELAENQAIVGVLLEGLQRCMVHDEGLMVNLPIDLKLQWIGEVQMIEEQNRVMSKACREVVEQFEKDGFRCCVLKGQANLRYYPEEMRLRRSSGDVDVWVKPVHGSRFTAYLWCMVTYGAWFITYGSWFMVHGYLW